MIKLILKALLERLFSFLIMISDEVLITRRRVRFFTMQTVMLQTVLPAKRALRPGLFFQPCVFQVIYALPGGRRTVDGRPGWLPGQQHHLIIGISSEAMYFFAYLLPSSGVNIPFLQRD